MLFVFVFFFFVFFVFHFESSNHFNLPFVFFRTLTLTKWKWLKFWKKTLEVLTQFCRTAQPTSLPVAAQRLAYINPHRPIRLWLCVVHPASAPVLRSLFVISKALVKAQLQNHLRSIACRMETRVVDEVAVPVASPTPA